MLLRLSAQINKAKLKIKTISMRHNNICFLEKDSNNKIILHTRTVSMKNLVMRYSRDKPIEGHFVSVADIKRLIIKKDSDLYEC